MSRSQSLVLASSSKYRRRLLDRLDIEFTVKSPEVDEFRRQNEAPCQMARRLAAAKARAIATDHPDKLVLGADQVVTLDDRIFQKPGDRTRAIEQLNQLSGKTHRLITAVALVSPGDEAPLREGTSIYEMEMRPLTDAAIRRYVDADRPFDCAGSYKIEAGGVRLFEATRGDDPTAIEGLPLMRVWSMLLDAGWNDD